MTEEKPDLGSANFQALPTSSASQSAAHLLDTMPWGVLMIDHQGVLTVVNQQAAAFWGQPQTALLGHSLDQASAQITSATLQQALQHALTQAEPVVGEFLLPQSQQWIAMLSDPQATGKVVYWQDITARKVREMQYEALAENIPDVITRWNKDLRLCYANSALEKQIGLPVPRLLDLTFGEMGAAKALAGPFMAQLQRVIDTGQPQSHQYTFPTPHGERHYDARLVPELRDDGVITVLAIARDITGLKQAETEALAQQQHLATAVLDAQETEKYRIAEALLNDLAQYLFATKLHLDQIDSAAPGKSKSQQKAAQLLGDAISQARTLAQLLTPATLDNFGLTAALQDIAHSYSTPQLSLACQIEQLPAAIPKSLQLAIYRMTQELANNIVKHAHATQARLHIWAEDQRLVVLAEDNGVGFRPGHVFDKNLGLKMLQDRTKLLNGTMEVISAPRKGTRIRLRIPLPPEATT
jgi:PAS domain S-box-containing protein